MRTRDTTLALHDAGITTFDAAYAPMLLELDVSAEFTRTTASSRIFPRLYERVHLNRLVHRQSAG